MHKETGAEIYSDPVCLCFFDCLVPCPGFYQELSEKVKNLAEGLQASARLAGIGLTTNCVGGMFGLFFSEEPQISNFTQVMACDQNKFKQFFHAMLDEGIYLAPSAFEAGFVSSMHSDEDIAQTINAATEVFKTL